MIEKTGRDVKVVVSLAAISHRLAFLPEVLGGLQQQSRRPDRLILWLSHEPFLLDQGVSRGDLPTAVLKMEERGEVEIRFTKNVGPHRKLLPTLKLFQEEADPPLIVTADDDTCYPARWLESLVKGFLTNRSAVCFRARRILFHGGMFKAYEDWQTVPSHEECLSYRLMATGCDGLLVHPQLLSPRIFDPDFLDLSLSRSDIWIAGALMSAGTPMLKLSDNRLFPQRGSSAGSPIKSSRMMRMGKGKGDSSHNLYLHNAAFNDSYIRRTMAFFASDCPTVRDFIANEQNFSSRPPFLTKPTAVGVG